MTILDQLYAADPVYMVVLGEQVDAGATALEHAQAYGFSVLRVHTNGVRAYSARLPQEVFGLLGRDPRVRCFMLGRSRWDDPE